MTQEQKELLLKDLCARLPYEPWVWFKENWETNPNFKGCQAQLRLYHLEYIVKDEDITLKPYLRPMSSMTEKEMEEYNDTWELDRKDILTVGDELSDVYRHKGYESIWEHPVVPLYRHIDWLNKNHFDYRGLIPMELALEALEGMYN